MGRRNAHWIVVSVVVATVVMASIVQIDPVSEPIWIGAGSMAEPFAVLGFIALSLAIGAALVFGTVVLLLRSMGIVAPRVAEGEKSALEILADRLAGREIDQDEYEGRRLALLQLGNRRRETRRDGPGVGGRTMGRKIALWVSIPAGLLTLALVGIHAYHNVDRSIEETGDSVGWPIMDAVFDLLLIVLPVVIPVVMAVLVLRWMGVTGPRAFWREKSAHDILDERLARGEIDKQEYQDRGLVLFG